MRMKYPGHPGGLIEMSLEELGVPVAVAASALGVSRQHLHNVIRGRSAISAEMPEPCVYAEVAFTSPGLNPAANTSLKSTKYRNESLFPIRAGHALRLFSSALISTYRGPLELIFA